MMVEVLERELHTFDWQNAARGRLGQGMEGGIDLFVIKRIIARLRALGNHEDAGLVQCIAAVGIWPNACKYEAKLCESDIFPYCNNATEDEFHFYWGCPNLRSLDISAVRRTTGPNWESADSLREGYSECFYLRGLVPAHWSTPEPVPQKEFGPSYDDRIVNTHYFSGDALSAGDEILIYHIKRHIIKEEVGARWVGEDSIGAISLELIHP